MISIPVWRGESQSDRDKKLKLKIRTVAAITLIKIEAITDRVRKEGIDDLHPDLSLAVEEE